MNKTNHKNASIGAHQGLTHFLIGLIFIFSFSLIFLFLDQMLFAQKPVNQWKISTSKDFRAGTLTDLLVLEMGDGALTIQPALRVIRDRAKSTTSIWTSGYDSAGNYLIWDLSRIDSGKAIYISKYDSSGHVIFSNRRANERPLQNYEGPFVFMKKNGKFLVTWRDYTPNNSLNHYEEAIYGQLFDENGQKISSNLQISETGKLEISPTIFVGPNGNFVVLWRSYSYEEKRLRIKYRILNEDGVFETDVRTLNTGSVNKFPIYPAGVLAPTGDIFVVWRGGGDFNDPKNIYIRRFATMDSASSPVVSITNNMFAPPQPSKMSVAADSLGNVLVAWKDSHHIFACALNRELAKLTQKLVIDALPKDQYVVNGNGYFFGFPGSALLKNGNFQVSWPVYKEVRRNVSRCCFWSKIVRIKPAFKGTFISRVFDSHSDSTHYFNLFWDCSVDSAANRVQFQLRAASNLTDLQEMAWEGSHDSLYYYKSGQAIDTLFTQNRRYIQIRAELRTRSLLNPPVLKEIVLMYSTPDTTAPAAPDSVRGEITDRGIRIRWDPSPDPDVAHYFVYKKTGADSGNKRLAKVLPPDSLVWVDTLVQRGQTYTYWVTAVDRHHNESVESRSLILFFPGRHIFVDAFIGGFEDGTDEHPFRTIEAALQKAEFGDTIRVLPGEYDESVHMKKGIALVGMGGARVTSIVAPKSENVVLFAADRSLVRGFTIRRTSSVQEFASVVEIHGDYFRFEENMVTSNLRQTEGVVVLNSRNVRISKNVIYGVGTGLGLNNVSGVVRNNLIFDVQKGLLTEGDDSQGELQIINNTLIAQTTGMWLRAYSQDIQNNIVSAFGSQMYRSAGIDENAFPTAIIKIEYNDVFGFPSNYKIHHSGGNNYSVDPHFADTTGFNYQLLPTSPCVDAGNSDPAFDDVDGSRNDLGAFGGPDPLSPSLFHPLISLSLPIISLSAGDSCMISLQSKNLAGFSQAAFALHIPSFVTILGIKKGALLPNDAHVAATAEGDSNVSVVISVPGGLSVGMGELLKLSLRVANNASPGASGALSILHPSLLDYHAQPLFLDQIHQGAVYVRQWNKGIHRIFVDVSAGGGGNGTIERPFSSIQKALIAAESGDTIFVAAGEYEEKLHLKSGVAIQGEGALLTKIEGSALAADTLAVGVRVKNVKIVGLGFLPQGELSSGIQLQNSQVVFDRCLFEGESSIFEIYDSAIEMGRSLIRELSLASAAVFTNSVLNVHDSQIQGGLNLAGGEAVVKRNRFFSSDNRDLLSLRNVTSCDICNNIFYGDGNSGATALRISGHSIGKFVNNTITELQQGVVFQNIQSQWRIENNIFVHIKNSPVVASDAGFISAEYSDFWGNGGNPQNVELNVGVIDSNPYFRSVPENDFRLSDNSPCIDSGNPNPAFNDPDGSKNDMGAFGGPEAMDPRDAAAKFSLPDSLNAKPGQAIEIPIFLENSEQRVASIAFSIRQNFGQSIPVSVEPVPKLSGFATSFDYSQPGLMKIVFSDPRGETVSPGEIAKIRVSIPKKQNLPSSLLRMNLKKVVVENDVGGLLVTENSRICGVNIFVTGVNSPKNEMPLAFSLRQNYPNPFNPTTEIEFGIPRTVPVEMVVFDALGRKIRTLAHRTYTAGTHRVEWNGRDVFGNPVSSGVYFYRMKAEKRVWMKKMLLLR